MVRPVTRLSALPLTAALLFGCGGESWFRDSDDVAGDVTAPESAVAGHDPGDRGAAAGGSPEIYHDLTRFDWYARGEPLMIGDRPYQPHGAPVAVGDRELKAAGEYDGVVYYVPVRGALKDGAVLVPVADSYWQPFAPAATTADAVAPEEPQTAE